jgi:hypothetical protein
MTFSEFAVCQKTNRRQFKRSSEIKTCPEFEVVFLPFYTQNERKMSETDGSKLVQRVDLNPHVPAQQACSASPSYS